VERNAAIEFISGDVEYGLSNGFSSSRLKENETTLSGLPLVETNPRQIFRF